MIPSIHAHDPIATPPTNATVSPPERRIRPPMIQRIPRIVIPNGLSAIYQLLPYVHISTFPCDPKTHHPRGWVPTFRAGRTVSPFDERQWRLDVAGVVVLSGWTLPRRTLFRPGTMVRRRDRSSNSWLWSREWELSL